MAEKMGAPYLLADAEYQSQCHHAAQDGQAPAGETGSGKEISAKPGVTGTGMASRKTFARRFRTSFQQTVVNTVTAETHKVPRAVHGRDTFQQVDQQG